MEIITYDDKGLKFQYEFFHKTQKFLAKRFINSIHLNHDEIAYVAGYVNLLKTGTAEIRNSFIAAAVSTIQDINGTGFYVITKNSFEYPRFALPDVSNIGALSYIDGCSNTELLSPVRIGFSTINYLHIPVHTAQTTHFHGSERIGFVAAGSGYAVCSGEKIELNTNQVFVLIPNEKHYFETTDNHLSIIVFHPDSDIGPTDEKNNMKIRTHI